MTTKPQRQFPRINFVAILAAALLLVSADLEWWGIATSPPRLGTRAGTFLKDPNTGRIYVRRKDCFSFNVKTQSLPRFREYVGFTIERKRKKLLEQTVTATEKSSNLSLA